MDEGHTGKELYAAFKIYPSTVSEVFVLYVSFLDFYNLVYVDESGLNREYRRTHARAKRGVKIHDTKPDKRQKRTNIVAGLLYGAHEKKHIAVQCYEHATTAAFFEDWFKHELIPLLPENAIIILDNASFRRKSILWGIARRHGVYLLFLPPY